MGLEKQIFNGTNGSLWMSTDNEEIELASVQSFSVTQTNNFEEFSVANDYGTHQRFLGYSLAGSISKYKIDNKMLNILFEYSKGNQPDIYLIGKVENPNTNKLERIKYTGITIDSGDIQHFEQKVATKEEIPFKAVKYTILDNN